MSEPTCIELLRGLNGMMLHAASDRGDGAYDTTEALCLVDDVLAAFDRATQRAEAAEAQRNNLRRALVDAMVERAVEAYDDAAIKSAITSLCSFKAMRAALDAALAVQP